MCDLHLCSKIKLITQFFIIYIYTYIVSYVCASYSSKRKNEYYNLNFSNNTTIPLLYQRKSLFLCYTKRCQQFLCYTKGSQQFLCYMKGSQQFLCYTKESQQNILYTNGSQHFSYCILYIYARFFIKIFDNSNC